MRWIVWILMLVSAAVGLALLMRVNHGNVAVLWPPYRVDVSVNLALLVLGLLFVALHLLMIAIGKALDLPERVRDYRERRGRDAAVMALRDAILALFEGRFGRAERLAQQAREDVQLAGPAALIAARTAGWRRPKTTVARCTPN
jgi:HemY protein